MFAPGHKYSPIFAGTLSMTRLAYGCGGGQGEHRAGGLLGDDVTAPVERLPLLKRPSFDDILLNITWLHLILECKRLKEGTPDLLTGTFFHLCTAPNLLNLWPLLN